MSHHAYVPDDYNGYECRRCGNDPLYDDNQSECPYVDSNIPPVKRRSKVTRLMREARREVIRYAVTAAFKVVGST